jgi:hypothetical protein
MGAVSKNNHLRREEQPPDEYLLQMMAAAGSQLGEFVKRKYAEKDLQEAEASIRVLYEPEKRQSEELAQKNLVKKARKPKGKREARAVCVASASGVCHNRLN